MNRTFLITALFCLNAYAKPPLPDDVIPYKPRTRLMACAHALSFSPLVAEDFGEVTKYERLDGKTGMVTARVSSDGMSLLSPAFFHYGGHEGNAGLIEQLLAMNPDFQDVDLTLNEADLAVYNATPGNAKAKVRATSAYRDFAVHGFTHVFMESVGADEVQITLSRRGMLWRLLRW